VSKIIPIKGQESHPRCKMLEELRLQTWFWTLLICHRPEDINTCWCFVYTFSGWVEDFPTQTEKAQEVARCLIKKIIPWSKYCVYWVRQRASRRGWGGIVGG
jgi:hypothetical protein